MIAKLQHWWQETRASFWFIPVVIVVGAVSLATGLIVLDANVELHVDKSWPLVFGAGATGSRGLLSAVASSMITVAGVVFSITIVALSLTSSQYTSRVLRNFMKDRNNQMVLGVFLGIFAYCLVVLRVIRSGDEGAFVPSLAVLTGLLLAFVGIGFLIFFIHHVAVSIQSSSIISVAARETIESVDKLFPENVGEGVDDSVDDTNSLALEAQVWIALPARKTGYIQRADGESLLDFACRHDAVVCMERGIGEFVVEGTPLITLSGPVELNAEAADDLDAIYVISPHRTVEQDVSFGIRQLVDIALKALSPGINDTTTAVMCVDYLTAILVRLASRPMPGIHRLKHGELRVIARGQNFTNLLAEAFDQIRQNACGNVAVLTRLISSLEIIARQTASTQRRSALQQQAVLIAELAERTLPLPYDRAGVRVAWVSLSRVLDISSGRLAASVL